MSKSEEKGLDFGVLGCIGIFLFMASLILIGFALTYEIIGVG